MGHAPRSLILLLLCAYSATAHALPTAIEKVGEEISRVENEILRGDSKNSGATLVRLRKLILLQKKEIKLTESRVRELTTSMASFAGRKNELEQAISGFRVKLYEGLKKLSVLVEEQHTGATLDALWLHTLDLESAGAAYRSRLAMKQSQGLARLKAEREQVLALEQQMSQERDALDYYAAELREKESVLIANEKLSQGLIARRQQFDREGLARLSRLRELREGERNLRKMTGHSGEDLSPPTAGSSSLYRLKGRLPLPVKGEIVSQYGRSYDTKTSLLTFQKGISISAFGGSDVKSVAAGKVVYAGALKNYGQMVIVEHEGQVYSLYGQLGDALVKEGGHVEQGVLLGHTRSEGAPLYFELRERNIAINPAPWLERVSLTMNR